MCNCICNMNKSLLCCLKSSLATPCNSDFHCRTKQSVVSILVLFLGGWVLTGSRENNGRKRQSQPKLKWHTQFFLWISLTNEFLEYLTRTMEVSYCSARTLLCKILKKSQQVLIFFFMQLYFLPVLFQVGEQEPPMVGWKGPQSSCHSTPSFH